MRQDKKSTYNPSSGEAVILQIPVSQWVCSSPRPWGGCAVQSSPSPCPVNVTFQCFTGWITSPEDEHGEEEGERQGGTGPHLALHSQALSENVSQKRYQHSTASCLLGKPVIQGRLTKIFHVSPKVAKGLKITLSFKQCSPHGTAGRNFPLL